MIRIDRNEIISELNLTPFGARGFFQDKNNACPFCKGEKKWGIVFSDNNTSFIFHCFKCGKKSSAFEFLKQIDRLDLIRNHYENSIKSSLVELVPEKEDEKEDDIVFKAVSLPFKLQRLVDDEYLNSRGFKQFHYDEFEPSFTESPLERELKNYIIFKMKMNGKIIAWLARSRHSKEWHEMNLKKAKEKGIKPKLRYENSKTDFTKILGGYDDISEKTQVVIIVEGLFDYIGLDSKLNLREDENIRCVFTFGNSISKEQISFLQKKKIERVILMYDPDKPDQIKSSALNLQKSFETKIALLKDTSKDPGNATCEELLDALDNLIDPINFRVLKKFL